MAEGIGWIWEPSQRQNRQAVVLRGGDGSGRELRGLPGL